MHDAHARRGFAAFSVLTTISLTGSLYAQGGEDATSAVPIAVPSTVSGTTVGFANDSDEVCPYTGSTAPDVYYVYTAPENQLLDLDTCSAGYDTKIYVYDENLELVPTSSGGLACDDDSCSKQGAFRSFINCVALSAGQRYFFVVDGWGGDAGSYDLRVALSPPDCPDGGPCIVDCPPGALVENEACAFGDSAPNDLFNGGCNCTDPNGCFGTLACGDVLCAQGYFDGAFRDTDWFAVDTTIYPLGAALTVSVLSEFDIIVSRLPLSAPGNPCSGLPVVEELIVGAPCVPGSFTTPNLDHPFIQIFAGANFTEIVDCNDPDGVVGADYILTLDCTIGCLDLDESGDVGFGDLLLILSNWGPCP